MYYIYYCEIGECFIRIADKCSEGGSLQFSAYSLILHLTVLIHNLVHLSNFLSQIWHFFNGNGHLYGAGLFHLPETSTSGLLLSYRSNVYKKITLSEHMYTVGHFV